MNKKSKIIFVLGVILLIVFGVGIGTFAYFIVNSNVDNSINGSTSNIDIEYTTSGDVSGVLIPTTNKEKGIITTVTARLKDDSIDTKFNMYITPTVIGDLATNALKWEVIGSIDNEVVYTNNGNFENAVENNKIIIVDEYDITKLNTNFKVYIWLDGTLINQVPTNNSFAAVISADSSPITSIF